MRASASRAVEPAGSLADAERLRKSICGSCSGKRRPPAFPTKEVRWPLSSINAAKRGAEKRSGVAEEILLKIVLKAKPEVYLKQT